MVYGPFKKLLLNNKRNLIDVIKVYTALLTTKYRVTIFYYPRINGIIEIFNRFLGNILIKILIN
jgi:hypothetical protein